MQKPQKTKKESEPIVSQRLWSAKYLDTEQTRTGFLEWWYALTAPKPAPPSASQEQRESSRRGRLTSSILLLATIIITLTILGFILLRPVLILENGFVYVGYLLMLIGLFASAWFNRRGQQLAAGICVTLVVSFEAPFTILTGGPLGFKFVFIYSTMVQSELVAASVLPPITVFLMAGLNILFIFADLYFQPHERDFDIFIHKAGGGIIIQPIILHIIVSIVLYIWVSNAMNALKRADRAQVIAELQHDLAAQNSTIAKEKRQLDESILKIVQTHLEVTRGNYKARVPMTTDNVLLEISSSLNNLIARLEKMQQLEMQLKQTHLWVQQAQKTESDLKRIQYEMARVVTSLQNAKANQSPIFLSRTSTILDELAYVLDGNYLLASKSPISRSDFNWKVFGE